MHLISELQLHLTDDATHRATLYSLEAVFMHLLNCTDGGRKDSAYVAAKTIYAINKFGAENVLRVLMDGSNWAQWPIIRTQDGLTLSNCRLGSGSLNAQG